VNALATTTTDVNGLYGFGGLAAGCYQVTATTPSGYTVTTLHATTSDKDSDNPAGTQVTLPIGGSDQTIDFGFVPPAAGQIGDFVWKDLNGNGVQDAGEPGIAGLTVTLGGTASGTTTTDGSGHYLFTGLSHGSYTVTVATPSGFSASPSNVGSPSTDSN